VVAFESAGMRCCLPIAEVERVFFLPATDPLPGAPPWVVGLLHLQGESVPVVDLALRLGVVPDAPHALDAAVLLCRRGPLVGGLLVERVLGICAGSRLGEADMAVSPEAYPLFRGMVRDGAVSLLMIELAQILAVAPVHSAYPVEAYLLGEAHARELT